MDIKRVLLAYIFITLVFFACDNSIQPLNKEKGIFSIYGYLNLNEDENYIRVKNLNKTLLEDTTETIDAEVTFQNLKSGKTEILEDSVVEFDGVKTHNFRTTMEIEPNTSYKVTAENSEGDIVSAKTETPYRANVNVTPKMPDCLTSVTMNFEPVRSKHALRIEMGFKYNGKIHWFRKHQDLIEIEGEASLYFTPLQIIQELTSNESEQGESFQEDVYCEDLASNLFYVRYTHYGPGLYGNETSDTLRVPGGAGRLGAFYRESFTFPIDTRRVCPPLC